MAEFRTGSTWPDSIDTSSIVLFVLLVVGLPALGYVFAAIDIRAYVRSLRRALVRITYYVPELPEWVRHETPPCLRALGLRAPCTEEEVKRAYRRLAQALHPDRGGDTRRFRALSEQFEKALDYVREINP